MLSKKSTIDDVKAYIYDWNIRFPLDRWWRQKHKVAFNSPEHRESCFIDQLIEFYEDEFFKELIEENVKVEDDEKTESYKRGNGNWINTNIKQTLTQKEVDDMFDSYEI